MCGKGKYSNIEAAGRESMCAICFRGQYNNERGKVDCMKCKEGRYIEDDGQDTTKHDDEVDCLVCDIGRHTNRMDGQSECRDCIAGTYGNKTDQIPGCEPCEPGKFSDKDRAQNCTVCPVGQSSQEGKTYVN